eukprot:scaffold85563_cov26-Tisochrysis_lutea.AAC.3
MSCEIDPDTATIVARTGARLFSVLCEQKPELPVTLLSPLSLSAAFALALAGATAGAQSERELQGLVGSEHARVAALSSSLVAAGAAGGGVTLDVANSVWLRKSIKPAFAHLLQNAHAAEVAALPATYEPVNSWVEKKTEGRITNLLSGEPDSLVVALLVNAVLFKGSWTTQFDEKLTQPGKFFPFDKGSPPLDAHFMSRKAQLPAAASLETLGGASAVFLDYGTSKSDFGALFVLPPEPGMASLASTVSKLCAVNLQDVLIGMTAKETSVALPRFRAESQTIDMVPAMRALGLRETFDGKSGFNGMSDDPDVHVDEVLHKVVIEVNEEGTVAAAATAVVMRSRSLPPPPLKLRFDRPFVMVVLHKATGLPLFFARLNQPLFL